MACFAPDTSANCGKITYRLTQGEIPTNDQLTDFIKNRITVGKLVMKVVMIDAQPTGVLILLDQKIFSERVIVHSLKSSLFLMDIVMWQRLDIRPVEFNPIDHLRNTIIKTDGWLPIQFSLNLGGIKFISRVLTKVMVNRVVKSSTLAPILPQIIDTSSKMVVDSP